MRYARRKKRRTSQGYSEKVRCRVWGAGCRRSKWSPKLCESFDFLMVRAVVESWGGGREGARVLEGVEKCRSQNVTGGVPGLGLGCWRCSGVRGGGVKTRCQPLVPRGELGGVGRCIRKC